MFTSAVAHRYGTERAWTEHLATTVGAIALLEAVRHAPLPEQVTATLDEVLAALTAENTLDADGEPLPMPTHLVRHQLHLVGRFPDVAVNDPRDRLFAVIEAHATAPTTSTSQGWRATTSPTAAPGSGSSWPKGGTAPAPVTPLGPCAPPPEAWV